MFSGEGAAAEIPAAARLVPREAPSPVMAVMPSVVVVMPMMMVRQNMNDRRRHVHVSVMMMVVAMMAPHLPMMVVVMVLHGLHQSGVIADRRWCERCGICCTRGTDNSKSKYTGSAGDKSQH